MAWLIAKYTATAAIVVALFALLLRRFGIELL